ncbi:hypothetical protein LIER_08525 [Lithospermum erythrorhizon]|uniref:Uncharacterized protein n=1 Tax=Lithospermum erythrorhizon TaxID=34254 RepID=A0AAV3PEA6_LITER
MFPLEPCIAAKLSYEGLRDRGTRPSVKAKTGETVPTVSEKENLILLPVRSRKGKLYKRIVPDGTNCSSWTYGSSSSTTVFHDNSTVVVAIVTTNDLGK